MGGRDELSEHFPKKGWNWITPDKYPRRHSRVARSSRERVRRGRHRAQAQRNVALAVLALVFTGAIVFALSRTSPPGQKAAAATGGLTSSADQGTNLLLASGIPANGQNVDGMQCYPQEATQMHLHVTLDIVVDGTQGQVPPGLGFVAPRSTGIPALGFSGSTQCIYPVHVHYPDNQVHVESPIARRYTLGEVFDLWGEPLSKTQFLGYHSDATHAIAFGFSFTSGKGPFQPYLDDPRNLPLLDNETIKIVYRTMPASAMTPAG